MKTQLWIKKGWSEAEFRMQDTLESWEPPPSVTGVRSSSAWQSLKFPRQTLLFSAVSGLLSLILSEEQALLIRSRLFSSYDGERLQKATRSNRKVL